MSHHMAELELGSESPERVQSLGQEDSLEEEMATHSSTLSWRILWTDEPGRLQSMGVAKNRVRLSN